MKHSPLPWTTKYGTNVCSEKGRTTASCGGDSSNVNAEEVYQENIANARFIVLACNYFEEMKEALKEAVLFYTEELEYIGGCDHEAGICVCGIKNDMARLEDLLRRIEEAERV